MLVTILTKVESLDPIFGEQWIYFTKLKDSFFFLGNMPFKFLNQKFETILSVE